MSIRVLSLFLFVTQVVSPRATPSEVLPPDPIFFDPVTGGFTAGQTVTATYNGAIPLDIPWQLELLDEGDALPLYTTPIVLNPSESLAPFTFVVPTTLSVSNLIVLVELSAGISGDQLILTSTIGTISITAASTASRSSTSVASESSSSATTANPFISTPSASVTGHPFPPSAKAKSNKSRKRDAIIGGTIGTVIVALTSFALLLWNRRNRNSSTRILSIYGDTDTSLDSEPRIFDVNDNAPITPFQGQNKAPSSSEQKKRPVLLPVRLRYSSSNIDNDSSSSSLRVNIGERYRQESKIESLLCDILLKMEMERDGNQVESTAKLSEHAEEILTHQNPIAYRHQDSGWRDPVELKTGRNQTVEGREVIELPPDYSKA